MGTTEIHEPEVREVKPVTRPAAPALPKKEIATEPFAPRTMFSDSLLDFGPARKRKAFATTTSFILNCLAINADADIRWHLLRSCPRRNC